MNDHQLKIQTKSKAKQSHSSPESLCKLDFETNQQQLIEVKRNRRERVSLKIEISSMLRELSKQNKDNRERQRKSEAIVLPLAEIDE